MYNRSYSNWLLYCCFFFFSNSQFSDLLSSSEREWDKKILVHLKDMPCLRKFSWGRLYNHNESHLHGFYSWMKIKIPVACCQLGDCLNVTLGYSLLLFSNWWLFNLILFFFKEHLNQNAGICCHWLAVLMGVCMLKNNSLKVHYCRDINIESYLF